MDNQTVIRAIDEVGSQRALADAVGVTPALVSQWRTGRRPVAAHHCIAIEEATRGRVTRYELRPKVFGPAPRKTKSKAA